MSDPRDDQWSVKTAAAVLSVCIARTLEQSDPSFADRFQANVERAYDHFRDNAGKRTRRDGSDRDLQDVLETLSWTRELLTGWNMISGQGEAFLKDQ
jgi:hypothetical protein